MGLLKGFFFGIFQVVYPLIHNHLVSYLIFFGLFAFLAYKNWTHIKKRPKRGLSEKTAWTLRVALEVLLLLFLAWFVLDHFTTFLLLSAN